MRGLTGARFASACVVTMTSLTSSSSLAAHRAGRVPAVFAHGDADANAALLEDRAAATDREVALLVEHAVVREEHLVVHGFELAVVDEGGGVEHLAVLVDETDDG